jgi:hypothetical protein
VSSISDGGLSPGKSAHQASTFSDLLGWTSLDAEARIAQSSYGSPLGIYETTRTTVWGCRTGRPKRGQAWFATTC